MERIGNRVSYIKKPLAKYSLVAAGLAVAAAVFCVAALAMAVCLQGNATLTAAALGFCSIITALSSIAYGIFSFFEKEKNYLLAKVSLVTAGIELFVWLVVIVLG